MNALTLTKVTLGFGISLLAAGCTSVGKSESDKNQHVQQQAKILQINETLQNVPTWYLRPPKSNNKGFYAAGTGKSSTLGMALTNARINTEFELAKKYNQIISGNEKAYTSETDKAKVVSKTEKVVDKLVANARLTDYQVEDTQVVREGASYRIYMLSFLPFESEAISQKNSRAVSQQSDKAFNELERRVDKVSQQASDIQ